MRRRVPIPFPVSGSKAPTRGNIPGSPPPARTLSLAVTRGRARDFDVLEVLERPDEASRSCPGSGRCRCSRAPRTGGRDDEPFVSSSDFFAIRARNARGASIQERLDRFRNEVYSLPVIIRLRYPESAPTFWEIDHSLS